MMYSFYPNFIKAIFIIFIYNYALYYYINHKKSMINLQTQEESSSNFKFQINRESYFLPLFFNILPEKNFYKYFIIGLSISIPKTN